MRKASLIRSGVHTTEGGSCSHRTRVDLLPATVLRRCVDVMTRPPSVRPPANCVTNYYAQIKGDLSFVFRPLPPPTPLTPGLMVGRADQLFVTRRTPGAPTPSPPRGPACLRANVREEGDTGQRASSGSSRFFHRGLSQSECNREMRNDYFIFVSSK